MKSALLVLLLVTFQELMASDFAKTYVGQGQLVTVRVTVADGKARIFLVGQETARIDLKNPAKLLKLTAFVDDGQKQELRFTADGEFYVAILPKKPSYSLSVSTQLGSAKEDVKVKLDGKP